MLELTVFILFIEALFFYIPLKEIKELNTKKDKIKLYSGIFLSNIISTLIFGSSIFRYILYFILIYFLLKIIDHRTRIYDFFIISFLLAYKLLIEFILAIIFSNNIVDLYIFFVIVMQTICIIFSTIISRKIKLIYSKIIKYWDCNKKFYLRYFMLIIFNSIILFFIYNLIKMSEVS